MRMTYHYLGFSLVLEPEFPLQVFDLILLLFDRVLVLLHLGMTRVVKSIQHTDDVLVSLYRAAHLSKA